MLATLAVRLVHLDHAPHHDEFYHILAAQSILEDGDHCIARCLDPYGRGVPFTYVVAGVLRLFGTSLLAARIVPLIGGLLLVAAVFWWTWRVASTTAATAGALLLAFSPDAIYLSQFIRFLSWHALLVWIGATALFFAVHPPEGWGRRRRWALVGLAAATMLGALTLEITTLMVGVGIGMWLLLDPITRWSAREVRRRPWRLAAASAAAVALAAVAFFVMVQSGLLEKLWHHYRTVSLFEALDEGDNLLFYHQYLLDSFPTFYTLSPVAFVIALWKRPRAAKFCAAIFGTALILQSGGGFKATRFLFYAMPFFFALWGIAIGTMLPPLVTGAREGVSAWLGTDRFSRLASRGGVALLGIAALTVLAMNPAFDTTLKMLTLDDAAWPSSEPPYRGRPKWKPAVPALKAIADTAGVVVTSAAVKALYYLGRSDVEVSVSRLYYASGFEPDFSLDPRVGLPVVKSPEAMERLMECYPSGLIVAEDIYWGAESGVPPETAAYIAAHAQKLDLPPGSGLLAYRWGPEMAGVHERCDPLPLEVAASEGDRS